MKVEDDLDLGLRPMLTRWFRLEEAHIHAPASDCWLGHRGEHSQEEDHATAFARQHPQRRDHEWGWYTGSFPDICVCIYTNGHCSDLTGREFTSIRVNVSSDAIVMTYRLLDAINPDFVSIHNGFNFDMRHVARSSTNIDKLLSTFEERRLGNSGVGVFWRLLLRSDWTSLSLANMCQKFGLPPKLDPNTIMIDERLDNDMLEIVVYNCRDADLHVWRWVHGHH